MGLSVMAPASARQCGSCGAILSAPESEQPYVIEFAPDQRNHPEGESQ